MSSGFGHEITERDAWLALAACDGVAEGLLGRFVRRFGSAGGTLQVAADPDAARAVRTLLDAAPRHLRPVTAERVREAALDPAAITRRLEPIGAWALTPLDPDYPDRLRTSARRSATGRDVLMSFSHLPRSSSAAL